MKALRAFAIAVASIVALITAGCCYRQPYGPSFDEYQKAEKGKNWYFGFNSPMKAIVSSPLLLNDKLYVTSIGGSLFCADKERGKPIETFMFNGGRPLKAGFRSGPVTDGKNIYVAGYDHNLYAVEPNTGGTLWAFGTNGKIEGAPALTGDKIYVGNWAGRLYCLDKENGQEVWFWEAGDKIRCTPAAFGGMIYFGDVSGRFYCITAGSQPDKAWEFEAGDEIYGEPVTDGNLVWFTSLDGNIYCLSAQTGEQKWVFETGNEIWAGPHLDHIVISAYEQTATELEMTAAPDDESAVTEGAEAEPNAELSIEEKEQLPDAGRVSPASEIVRRLYIGSMDARLYILDADTGEFATYIDETGETITVQPYKCGDGINYDQGIRGPVTTDERYVYFNAGDFFFRALDKVTGRPEWAFETRGEVRGKPLVFEGKVVFGCDDTYFYGLKIDSGHPIKGAL